MGGWVWPFFDTFPNMSANFNSSLTLYCVYATDLLPAPSIALTGSIALRNFLFIASIGGDYPTLERRLCPEKQTES